MTRGYHNPGFKQTITVRMRTQKELQKIIGSGLTKNLTSLQKSMYDSVRDIWKDNRLAGHVGRLFEDKMNQYERDHKPKMVTDSPEIFGNLRTDCWGKTYVTMSSQKSDEIKINIVGRNLQQDFLYTVTAYKRDNQGFKHPVLYSGVVGNLAARRLTRKLGYYYPRNTIKVSATIGDSAGGYLGSARLAKDRDGRKTQKLVMYKGTYPIFGDKFRLYGSYKYRQAVIGTMRYAVQNTLKLYERPESHIPKKNDTHIGLRYDYE